MLLCNPSLHENFIELPPSCAAVFRFFGTDINALCTLYCSVIVLHISHSVSIINQHFIILLGLVQYLDLCKTGQLTN